MKTVIEMALEAGFDADDEITLTSLERFAALVIANHPPQSYMTWQEGYEAGKQAEREACAKVLDEMAAQDKLTNYYGVAANAIRARGETK